MPVQNCNVHVVFDGHWAIAAEGEGRLQVGLDMTSAIALATSLAVERQAMLYVHDKNGDIIQRIDCSRAMPSTDAISPIAPIAPVAPVGCVDKPVLPAEQPGISEKARNTSVG
ncbi:hypothetical protein Tamer19_74620 [Cupriavidus sp. TA19]|uniref:DUF2188 domain-containing protein n=1 Tax=unclassified Cupriavidus TaxID=2640874 RepID=UPI0013140B38|nr:MULTISPECIES: DUF2188 domain-containing protein [unclassified Cupriavidus]BDB24129.1 DUF2188 domain-containing protein [Cupriavidus sp. P-10]GLC98053.1 hypothetical protein Tamer19_74620 [Cupriavidus sp. TA19]